MSGNSFLAKLTNFEMQYGPTENRYEFLETSQNCFRIANNGSWNSIGKSLN